jgi:sortase A
MVILGHRDTHFRTLQALKPSDLLELEDRNGQRRQYRVSEIEILQEEKVPERIQEHREKSSMLLMTCYPFQYIGPAPRRYLVWTNPVAPTRKGEI